MLVLLAANSLAEFSRSCVPLGSNLLLMIVAAGIYQRHRISAEQGKWQIHISFFFGLNDDLDSSWL